MGEEGRNTELRAGSSAPRGASVLEAIREGRRRSDTLVDTVLRRRREGEPGA